MYHWEGEDQVMENIGGVAQYVLNLESIKVH